MDAGYFLPRQQLKPDLAAEALHHGQVDPEKGELLHQLEAVVSADVVTCGEAGVFRKRYYNPVEFAMDRIGVRAITIIEVIRSYGLELMGEFGVPAG